MNTRKRVTSAACLAVLLVSGCMESRIGGRTPTDAAFGQAVRAAQVRQTLNPAASSNPAAPEGLDGPAAKGTIDRYQKSFESPPAPVNVYTIGVGGGASGASP